MSKLNHFFDKKTPYKGTVKVDGIVYNNVYTYNGKEIGYVKDEDKATGNLTYISGSVEIFPETR